MKYLLVLTALLLAFTSCTSSSDLDAQTGLIPENLERPLDAVPATPPQFSLPALPELGGARAVSECEFEPLLQYGDAAIANAPTATPDNTEQLMLLTAPANQASWSLYQFTGFDAMEHPSGIELLTNDASDQQLFFALANYTENRWEFSSVDLIGQEGDLETIRVDIADDAPYRSPVTDSLFFVVIAYNDVHVEVKYLGLQFGIHNVWVQNIQASDATDPNAITITWDAVPDAVSYEVYYRFYNFIGDLLLLTETTDPSFVHSTTEPPGKEVIPEEPYIYFVAAKYEDGTCSQLSGYDIGVTATP